MKGIVKLVIFLILTGNSFSQNKNFISFDSLITMGYKNALNYNDSIFHIYCIDTTMSEYSDYSNVVRIRDNYILISRVYDENKDFDSEHIDVKHDSINIIIQIITVNIHEEKNRRVKEFNMLVDKGDAYYKASDFSNAYIYYKKASLIDPLNKMVIKKMNKSEKLVKKNS